jgi:hypothetical protein
VRLVFEGSYLVIDPASLAALPDLASAAAQRGATPRAMARRSGRGAYVHPRAACVTVAGLSRSLRRAVRQADVARIVSQMSPIHDNLGDQPLQNASQNGPGLADGDTVEMPPRIKAKRKDDRSEDARL